MAKTGKMKTATAPSRCTYGHDSQGPKSKAGGKRSRAGYYATKQRKAR